MVDVPNVFPGARAGDGSLLEPLSVDLGDVSGAVTLDDATATAYALSLSGDAVITVPDPDPESAISELLLYVVTNGHALTVAGEVLEAFPAEGPIVLLGVRGTWHLYAAGSTSGGGDDGGGGTPPDGWAETNTDSFTDADGTPLDGRAADTGGTAWAQTGDQAITIQSNRAQYGTNANNAYATLPIGGGGSATGVRATVDYLLDLKEADGSKPLIGVGFDYHSTNYGNTQNAQVTLEANASSFDDATTFDSTMSLVGGGADNLQITAVGGADLAHIPGHATLQFAIEGTAISVSINGTVVATGTVPGTLIGSTLYVRLSNRYPRLDNLVVETKS